MASELVPIKGLESHLQKFIYGDFVALSSEQDQLNRLDVSLWPADARLSSVLASGRARLS